MGACETQHEGVEMKSSGEQYVIDDNGKKTGVILPFEQYEKLLADLHDLAVVAERRDETPITIDEMRRRLNADGAL